MFSIKTIRATIQLRKGQFGDTDSNTVTIEGLPTEVSIQKQGGEDPNRASVLIKNLKIDTVKQLTMLAFKRQEVYNNYLQIEAGNKGMAQLATIFTGEIINAVPSADTDGTLALNIEANAGYYAAILPTPPVSVNGVASIEGLMEQFANEANYKFENRGISGSVANCVFIGSPVKKAQTLARQCDFDLLIDDGTFIIQPWEAPKNGEIPLINRDTGLLGYPSYTNDGISFTCIFNDRIKVGGYVKLESLLPYATGEWQVVQLSHNLVANDSTNGAWETSVDCVIPGTPIKKNKAVKGNAGGYVGGGTSDVDTGLQAGADAWMGVTMDNGQVGCAEAAGKIGSYYSPFLAQESQNGVVSVPGMVDDAGSNCIPFDSNQLQKGDCIIYGDNDHVVIYDGAGGYYGNSSSQNMVVHGSDYNEMGMTPTKIIKTSQI